MVLADKVHKQGVKSSTGRQRMEQVMLAKVTPNHLKEPYIYLPKNPYIRGCMLTHLWRQDTPTVYTTDLLSVDT